MIIGIPTPNNYLMPLEAVKSLVSLPYEIVWATGPYIYENRNTLLEIARHKKESVLMIDADIVYTSQDVRSIENYLNEYDLVSGLYPIGTEPHQPCVFKKTENDYVPCDPPTTIQRVDAVGGGFLGIAQKVVQQLPPDIFNDIWEGKVKHGEDISFCHKVNELGFRIFLDPQITVGHLRMKILKLSPILVA